MKIITVLPGKGKAQAVMRISGVKWSGGRSASRIRDKVGHMAVALYRRPVIPFIAIVLIFSISLYAAGRLRLENDLAGLLPRSYESVRDLEELKSRYGGEGYLVVVGLDADPEALRRFSNPHSCNCAVSHGRNSS
ncbi:MAG: hypothetical protein AB9866_11565 [Syntrophobacteraceae bacterium]